MMKGVILVAILGCFYGAVQIEASCNVISTAKIIGKLCYLGDNRNNQSLVDGFFGCYKPEFGKQIFIDCQTQAFGAPMDTTQNVDTACRAPWKIPAYSGCLKTEFAAAGQDMNAAVVDVNKCQSRVMGIGPGIICD